MSPAGVRGVFSDFDIFEFQYGEFAGWRTPEVFREMFARHGIADAPVEACSTRKTARARQLIDADFPLSPGCVATIDGWIRAPALSADEAPEQSLNPFVAKLTRSGGSEAPPPDWLTVAFRTPHVLVFEKKK